tara:strand:- start:10736 stop:11050 length:315 start_codon:yes stop_codon:yes gene_type:complete
MPHYNLLGQEINVGDIIFETYPSTPSGWVSEGVVTRFTEKSVFYIFYDRVGGELIERERYCKPKYIIKSNMEELATFINSPRTNDWTRSRATNLFDKLREEENN